MKDFLADASDGYAGFVRIAPKTDLKKAPIRGYTALASDASGTTQGAAVMLRDSNPDANSSLRLMTLSSSVALQFQSDPQSHLRLYRDHTWLANSSTFGPMCQKNGPGEAQCPQKWSVDS